MQRWTVYSSIIKHNDVKRILRETIIQRTFSSMWISPVLFYFKCHILPLCSNSDVVVWRSHVYAASCIPQPFTRVPNKLASVCVSGMFEQFLFHSLQRPSVQRSLFSQSQAFTSPAFFISLSSNRFLWNNLRGPASPQGPRRRGPDPEQWYRSDFFGSDLSARTRLVPELMMDGRGFGARPRETPPAGPGSAVPSPLQSSCRVCSCPGMEMDFAVLGALRVGGRGNKRQELISLEQMKWAERCSSVWLGTLGQDLCYWHWAESPWQQEDGDLKG